jgi:hypothetical protein
VTGVAGLGAGAGRDAADCSGAAHPRLDSEPAADKGSIWRLCSLESGRGSLAPVSGHEGATMAPSMGPGMDPDLSRSFRGPIADAQEPWCVHCTAAHRLPMRRQLRESGALPSDCRSKLRLVAVTRTGVRQLARTGNLLNEVGPQGPGLLGRVPSAERGLERSTVQETPRTEARCDVCVKGNPAAPSPTAPIFSAPRMDGKVPPHRPISAMVLGETRDSGGKRSQRSKVQILPPLQRKAP